MERRKDYISGLRSYLSRADKEITMILQSLQWNEKTLLQNQDKISCAFNPNHNITQENKECHEKNCAIKSLGYSKQDILLPDPLNSMDSGVVIITKKIIRNETDIELKKESDSLKDALIHREPLTLERMQCEYTREERLRAYDLAVTAFPATHDLTDLELPTSRSEEKNPARSKSKLEVLAELRDMKRRRAKYRAPVHTSKYSDVLRGLISTQMELYNEAVKTKQQLELSQTEEREMQKYCYNSEAKIYKEDSKPKYSKSTSQFDKYRKNSERIENNSYEVPHKRTSEREKYRHKSSSSSRHKEHYYEDHKRHNIKKEKLETVAPYIKKEDEKDVSTDTQTTKNQCYNTKKSEHRELNKNHKHNKEYKSHRKSSHPDNYEYLDDREVYKEKYKSSESKIKKRKREDDCSSHSKKNKYHNKYY